MSSRGLSTFMPHMNDRLSMPMPPLNTQDCVRNPSPNPRVHAHTKKAMLSLSLACNFEAFSLHFHLPLKTAAEKFGVRATAFKKRCRAIGIRHWPYRKVRSLKRSLQELNRSKEQGELNEKQQYQYTTFKKQLDKLMAPETYGIDPSGRIPQHHFEEDSEEEGSFVDDDSYASQSPRYNASFTECTISPMETDKTFEFSGPSHLRSHRKQHAAFSSAHLSTKPMISAAYANDIPTMSYRSTTTGFKFPFGGYDHYLHDTTMEKLPMLNHTMHHPMENPYDHSTMDPHGPTTNDLIPAEVKYDEVRPLQEDDLNHTNPLESTTNQMDYSNERFFDDVFLQISPDYGCLV